MRLYRLLLILGTKKEMARQGDYFNRFFWLYSFSACVYFSFTHTQLRTLSSFFSFCTYMDSWLNTWVSFALVGVFFFIYLFFFNSLTHTAICDVTMY